MRPIKIYMGDLTHDTVVLVSDTIPINIGAIASYAKEQFGDQIDVSLFKYPQTIIDAINNDPPDVLALSNYSWNSNLSERVAGLAKQLNPDVVTVQGGTNFPHASSQHRNFLMKRPNTDIHVELEGEVSFSNVLARALAVRNGTEDMYGRKIDGCVFIDPASRFSANPVVISGNMPDRLRNLDVIPSPYLNGMLEHFFDGRLTPFLETNRGCPFKCSFCHTGNDYFQKTNTYSIDRIREEIEYIAPRVSELGIVNLHIADTNFGMYPRDREICLVLKDVHDKYGWPLQIMGTTGKNNKERVIEITGIMGKVLSVSMSVQSMDPKVLSNIKRDNIKLDDFARINGFLNEQGRVTKGELILGMPGESRETFIRGLDQMVESGLSEMCIYTLMLLHGTEFQEPEYRKKHGLQGKFRIVPLNFGEYENSKVLDYEEVCVRSNDMSFEDYLYLRGIALLVEALHNGRPFEEFFRFALSLGVTRTQVLRRVYDHIGEAPEEVRSVMDSFLEETKNELWDSEEEMVAHYQIEENYQQLQRGEVGGNLIYKYKGISMVYTAGPWISFLANICKEIAKENLTREEITNANIEIDFLVQFCQNRIAGLLDIDGEVEPLFLDSSYDVTGWLQSDTSVPLTAFACQPQLHYEFYYTEEQLRTRSDQFKRYGTDANALSKIVTRVSSIESLMRNVRTPEGEQAIYKDTDIDRLTRYTLSS